MLVQRLEANAAGTADGLGDRSGRGQPQRPGLEVGGEPQRVGGHPGRQLLGAQGLAQQRSLDAVEPGMLFQMVGQGPRAATLGQRRADLRHATPGQQVEQHGGVAVAGDRVAQPRRGGVHQAALDAAGGDDKLALAVEGLVLAIVEIQPHRLHRRAGKTLGEIRAPSDVETAVGRLQRRQVDAARRQPGRPGAVAAKLGPARAAQRQHHRIHRIHSVGLQHLLALRRGKAQQRGRISVSPAQPAVAHVQPQSIATQAVQPGPQQRRSLHLGRKHPARAADKGLDAQARGPIAQILRAEGRKPGGDLVSTLGVTADERLDRLAVRQVQTALAGEQELAAHRGHRVVQVDAGASLQQDLGGHQAGGAAADDRDPQGRR